jgi:DNA-binding NarL/FixJ family response regulator
VALCDDHGVVRSGLRLILEAADDIVVVGQAPTGNEAIAMAADVHPDVLVMDVGLPDMSGIDATAKVLSASPGTRVLVLSVHDDVAYLRGSFDAGAAGYLLKEAADVELVEAVRQVASGRQYVHPTMGAALLAPDAGPRCLGGPGGQLSYRETEVLRLVALGLTNPQIAEDLIVSVRTVETHRSHIYQKLDVSERADLVRIARKAGLLDDDPG